MSEINEYLFIAGDPNKPGTSCDLVGPIYPICEKIWALHDQEPYSSEIGIIMLQRICWLAKLEISRDPKVVVGLCALSSLDEENILHRTQEILNQPDTPDYIIEEALKLREHNENQYDQ